MAFIYTNSNRLVFAPYQPSTFICVEAPIHCHRSCLKARNRRPCIQRVSASLKGTASPTQNSPSHTTQGAQAVAAPTSVPPSLLNILSTIVGICVLIGSMLYKIPQVFRVVRRRSAAGISVLMYSLETVGTTFSALYFARRAFPFSTYGETVFIMIQNIVLLALIVYFQRLPRIPAIIIAIAYFTAVFALLLPVVPLSVLVALQLCSIPILNLARVPQIILNYRRKETGELSPITLGLQLLGNVARVFTTIAQVRDPLMFIGICVATCFNTALFAQWLYYSRRQPYSAPPLT